MDIKELVRNPQELCKQLRELPLKEALTLADKASKALPSLETHEQQWETIFNGIHLGLLGRELITEGGERITALERFIRTVPPSKEEIENLIQYDAKALRNWLKERGLLEITEAGELKGGLLETYKTKTLKGDVKLVY